MENHERNLFISLCLGLQLEGTESKSQLDSMLTEFTAIASKNKVQPLQDDLADWLDISIARCSNQQEASIRLWNKIDEQGYSLVDVPMKIRRRAFGGSTEIQKRHAGNSLLRTLIRRFESAVRTLVMLAIIAAALAAAIWYAWKQLGP